MATPRPHAVCKMPGGAVAISSFGALLRRHRLALGLTQEELAERAGLSGRAISDLERGLKQSPHPSTIRLLVSGLQLDPTGAEELVAAVRSPGRKAVPASSRSGR